MIDASAKKKSLLIEPISGHPQVKTFLMFHRSFSRLGAKIAVVLSGCGVYDGAEIHESTATLIHLQKLGAEVTCFAPDALQAHVVNHQVGAPAEGESRNIMIESARIARGPVQDLATIDAGKFDALFFPGGFGVMKNLSNFAFEGQNGKSRDDVHAAIAQFHLTKKPIGATCIAPVLLAFSLGTKHGGDGCSITMGADSGDAVTLARFLGAECVAKDVTGIVHDERNNLVTTPAYMIGTAGPADVYDGIGACVAKVLQLTKK